MFIITTRINHLIIKEAVQSSQTLLLVWIWISRWRRKRSWRKTMIWSVMILSIKCEMGSCFTQRNLRGVFIHTVQLVVCLLRLGIRKSWTICRNVINANGKRPYLTNAEKYLLITDFASKVVSWSNQTKKPSSRKFSVAANLNLNQNKNNLQLYSSKPSKL